VNNYSRQAHCEQSRTEPNSVRKCLVWSSAPHCWNDCHFYQWRKNFLAPSLACCPQEAIAGPGDEAPTRCECGLPPALARSDNVYANVRMAVGGVDGDTFGEIRNAWLSPVRDASNCRDMQFSRAHYSPEVDESQRKTM